MHCNMRSPDAMPVLFQFNYDAMPTDNISAVTTVQWIRQKFIRTVQCCVVYYSCAQSCTHANKQFLQVN